MNRLPRLASRDWIGLFLVLAGFILRLRQYLANRSLWVDEAMLANNILQRDFAGLFLQLDNDQGAPIGFLLFQKAVTLTLGDSEFALRLLPFLAGCLSLVLIFLLTRKVSSAFTSNLALALFAFSPALIYYSSEVKQYSTDVAIALALTLLFLDFNSITAVTARNEAVSSSRERLLREKRPRNDAIGLALAGALAIWFSHPALFVVGALGLALFVRAVQEKHKRGIFTLFFIALVWSLSLAALYFVNLRALASHQFFLDYWRDGFLPRDASALRWLAFSLHGSFLDLLGVWIPYLLPALLFVLGMIGLTHRLPRFGLFLLLIFFLTLLASFLTLYPFARRMILFLVPAMALLLAEGVDLAAVAIGLSKRFAMRLAGKASSDADLELQGAVRKPVRLSAALVWTTRLVLAGFLLFGPFSLAVENFAAPKMPENIRPAMLALQEEWEEGDLIYVYHWAEHAVRFYASDYGFDMACFILGSDHHNQPELYIPELDALRGHGRVWFLFSHVYEQDGFNERDFILSYVNSIGRLVEQIRRPEMSVFLYLYDLR